MAIVFDREKSLFHLYTKETSYVFGIFQNKLLNHIYYGERLENICGIELVKQRKDATFSADASYLNASASTDALALEFSTYGNTDFRTPTVNIENGDGSRTVELLYKSHTVFEGKKDICGMPSVYCEEGDKVQTLEIECYDKLKNITVVLSYSVFEDFDIITRNIKIVNNGEKIALYSAQSMSMDFADSDFDFVHLHGAWARERHIERTGLMNGKTEIASMRGASSHMHSPFFALCRKSADENNGDVYGFSLVYSGCFAAGAEVNHTGSVRAYMGINSFNFRWILDKGETFQTPEVVMTFSAKGFNKMSQNFHKIYRTRMCRGVWRDKERPILINNWEATYFDFNEEKIINIAKEAQKLGVELMVLDDGWFGKRNMDNCSLGDWYPDKNKLPGGIIGLSKRITALRMKFGLWYEPEMISPDSDLYRAHPDWAIHVEGRTPSLGRNQLVLDLSRKDVREYIIGFLSDMLGSADISYVKWDYNRNITDCFSEKLPPEHMGELMHRYMLGLYEILDTVTKKFPNVLFEGCSGGGGRFDAAMLAYFPQYWTSDDTDAVERMKIQYGTSMVMPSVAMGAHISAVPNHQVGRVTPLKTRGNIAMMGQFGYELDLGLLTDEEKEEVKNQIQFYKQIREVVHKGTMYRLESPFKKNHIDIEFISEDENTVILFHANVLGQPNPNLYRVKLKGLDENALYKDEDGNVFSGAVLLNMGITKQDEKDFESEIVILKRV